MGHDVKLLGYHVGGIRTFPCVGMSQNELSSSHPALQQDCRDMPQNQFIFTTNMIYGFATLTNIAADFDSPLSQEVSMG